MNHKIKVQNDRIAAAGLSVIRPVVKDPNAVKVDALPYEPRRASERVCILAPKVIETDDGKSITIRQVAVWPSNVNAKSKPTHAIGLVECRETGEVFFLWSHIGKTAGGQYAPKVYDLAPELLTEVFERAERNRNEMPAELRASLGML